jgi:hypothetical protein
MVSSTSLQVNDLGLLGQAGILATEVSMYARTVQQLFSGQTDPNLRYALPLTSFHACPWLPSAHQCNNLVLYVHSPSSIHGIRILGTLSFSC